MSKKHPELWRISPFPDLKGIGGTLADGRWHSRGRPVVYLSEHPALAMLETLVHLGMDPSEIPDTFNLLRVQVPDEAEIERIEDLPPDWRDQLHDTRQRGDQWLREGTSLLLSVPSAAMCKSQNFLYNPQHPHADEVELTVEEHELDRRLLRTYFG